MSLFAALFGRRRAPQVADVGAFAAFLAAQGAFVAQKTVMDYCGVKLGVNWQKAQEEPVFAELLADCRWRVYFAAQGDVAAMAESWLRPFAPGREAALAEALAGLAAEAIGSAGAPPRLAAEAEAARAGMAARLAQRQLAAPRPANTLALDAGPVLLETLPIHPDLRKGERVSILGGLRMHIVAAQQEMERRFAPAPLAAALTERAP
ncbi:hypothetical protein [Elioraea tepidiphila]|jgi:hypothetical protein|uniref:hypothetical protein n=1 Tax=Elioraea tepidiphila TaxID=457934 RepID=UPI000378C76B|nr:hypothetical protein [Elioraea tepidiphila]